MTDDLEIVVVPRELYYHEVAYVRGLEAEIEQLRSTTEISPVHVRELQADNARLRALLHEAWAVMPPCPFREQLRLTLENKP